MFAEAQDYMGDLSFHDVETFSFFTAMTSGGREGGVTVGRNGGGGSFSSLSFKIDGDDVGWLAG